MNEYDFINKLEAKFPLMFSNEYGGICVDEGWWPIIESLCNNIQHHIDSVNESRNSLLVNNPWKHKIPEEVCQVVVSQIKEKFGGLRFYYDGGDDNIDGMVAMAESWANKTCEACGTPATKQTSGWIKTVCDKHYDEFETNRKARNG